MRIGLDEDALAAIALGDDVVKAGVRDLAPAVARGIDAATTVASTAHLAARAGIGVFATGGLGGVHRGARETWDESADLTTLARTAIVVVCAGVKSILDVGATLERLETLNVTVVGYRTDALPRLLPQRLRPSRCLARRDARARSRRCCARATTSGSATARSSSPTRCPADEQLDPALHDRVLRREPRGRGRRRGRGASDVTPFLLDRFHRETGGASLEANVAPRAAQRRARRARSRRGGRA